MHSQNLLARLANTINADTLVGVAASSEHIPFIRDESSDVDQCARIQFLARPLIIRIVEADCDTRCLKLSIDSDFTYVSPIFILSNRFEERQLQCDASAGSCNHNRDRRH